MEIDYKAEQAKAIELYGKMAKVCEGYNIGQVTFAVALVMSDVISPLTDEQKQLKRDDMLQTMDQIIALQKEREVKNGPKG